MAKLGEPLRSAAGIVSDASGVTLLKRGYSWVMEEAKGIDTKTVGGKISLAYSYPAGVSMGVMAGMEEVAFPVMKHLLSSLEGEEFYEKVVPAAIADILSTFGIIGLAFLTRQPELAVGAKVVYNVGASAVPRAVEAIKRRRATTA
jgi:hypothetical protein